MMFFIKRAAAFALLLALVLFSPGSALGEISFSEVSGSVYFTDAAISVANDPDGNGNGEGEKTGLVGICLEPCGLRGVANLSSLDNSVYITAGSLTVNKDATLEVTEVTTGNGAAWTGEEAMTVVEEIGKSRELDKGENHFDLIDELVNIEDLDPDGDGVSMGRLRELTGNVVILEGTLSAGDVDKEVILTLVLDDLLFGDLDDSGKVNVSDAILVLRHIVGLTTLDANQRLLADVNADGNINVSDAINILRFIVDLTGEFAAAVPLIIEEASVTTQTVMPTGAIENPPTPVTFPDDDGLNGEIPLFIGDDLLGDFRDWFDLDYIGDYVYVIKGSLTVTKPSMLRVTGVKTGEGALLSDKEVMDMLELFGVFMNLDKGETTLIVTDYLGDEDDGEEGVSISLLEDLLGRNPVIEGNLFSRFGDSEKVSLTITRGLELPEE